MKEYQLYIDGKFKAALSGKVSEQTNPANGEVFAGVHQAGVADAQTALDSAEQAFKSWKGVSPSQRENIFIRLSVIILERQDELRELLHDEAGSTKLKAAYEINRAATLAKGMSGDCRRVYGETYLSNFPGVNQSYSTRRPLGVVLAISPFNFPLMLGLRKVGWALAAGNCVILKPSEVTPIMGLKLGEMFSEAGLPDGVLNVIPAEGAELGDSLIGDPRVKMLTFTGSSKVGKLLSIQAATYHKKCSLEMGGKNPIIILNDARLDYAVDVAAFSNFMHQGQVCMSGSRVIVEAGIYDEFCEKLKLKAKSIKVGDPREPGVIIGPLIRNTQAPFIQAQIDSALSSGARLLCGGSYNDNYYQPTVLADVTESMSIFRTECFGPVAAVVKADDYLHAIDLANDNDYGLSSAVLTNDLKKAMTISEELEAGMVHVNGPTIRDDEVVPFGGVKNSGTSREGGRFAMEEFTELKWVTIQTSEDKFPF